MAVDKLDLHLSGGAPWGFRLIGGDTDPLLVAKVRQRGKAESAGLHEDDVLLAINNVSCAGMSHGTAMGLVDAAGQALNMLVMRGSTDAHIVAEVFRQLEGQLQKPSAASDAGSSSSQKPHALSSSHLQNLTPFKTASTASSPAREMLMNGGTASPRHVPSPNNQQQQQQHQPYKPPPMFHVANNTGQKPKPGTWQPSGAIHQATALTISAPPGMTVQSNADAPGSFTMSFGLDDTASSKENQPPQAAPALQRPSMFKVNKFTPEPSAPASSTWKPSGLSQSNHQPSPPQQQQPKPSTDDSIFHGYRQGYMETEDLPALAPDVKVFDLTRILKGEASDDVPDSPGISSRKKMYADSAFYDDPEHKYPTIEEQIKMARNVARSLLAPANKKARGHTMFVKRRQRSDKWVAGQKNMPPGMDLMSSEEDDEKYYRPDPWAKTHTWQPPAVPAPPVPPVPGYAPWEPEGQAKPWKAPVLPTLSDSEEKTKALSADEFEKMRLFDQKTTHDQVSPQMCFNLADDLKNMKGRGGKLFAKRRAKAEKWAVEENVEMPKPSANTMQKILSDNAMSRPDLPEPKPAASAAPVGGHGGSSSVKAGGGGGPRLHQMIEDAKQACTPWDAAARGDSVDAAFAHLRKTNIKEQLAAGGSTSTGGYPAPSHSSPAKQPWAPTTNSKPKGFKPVNFSAPTPAVGAAPLSHGSAPSQPMVTCGDDGFSDL